MRALLLLTFCFSLVFIACNKPDDSPVCTNDTNPTETYNLSGDTITDLKKLGDLWNEVNALSQNKDCTEDNNCYSIAIGEEACGNPIDYIVFSCSNVDYPQLAEKVHALNDFLSKTHVNYNILGNCDPETEPQLVCRLGICEEM